MKKVILLLLVVLMLFSAVRITRGCLYPRYGRIIAVEYDYDDVIIEDAAGLTWIWQGCEDWTCGDHVAMLMFNRFTPNIIFDDVILQIR